MAIKAIQIQKLSLAGSGCTSTATSIIVKSFALNDGTLIVTADLGTICYATIEPATSREEQISFTGITQNTDGTATLTGVTRGLAFTSPYAAVAANRFAHAGSTVLVISNTAAFENSIQSYVDNAVIAEGVPGTNALPGIGIVATQAQIDAGTATESYDPGSGAANYPLNMTPDQLALSIYATRLPSADQKAALAGTGTPSGSNKFVTADGIANKADIKFGGTGADGALAITTGTTTIDLAGAKVVVKNYTSISITGDGKLAFTNPHASGTVVVLKSQGNVTLTSSQAPMIDASGLGGNSATAGIGTAIFKCNNGATGSNSASTAAGGAAVPTAISLSSDPFNTSVALKYSKIWLGGGGGNGGNHAVDGSGYSVGPGGRGGGALIMECAGAWNFTTASGISVAGKNGGNAVKGLMSGNSFIGGGGGGGGGYFLGLYNTLTANTGTVTVSAGVGGNGAATGSSNSAAGGGGGASAINAGADSIDTIVDGAKDGGDGGAGLAAVISNTEYA